MRGGLIGYLGFVRRVSTVRGRVWVDVLVDNLGSPERFRRVGIEGPKISVSRIPVRRPF